MTATAYYATVQPIARALAVHVEGRWIEYLTAHPQRAREFARWLQLEDRHPRAPETERPA